MKFVIRPADPMTKQETLPKGIRVQNVTACNHLNYVSLYHLPGTGQKCKLECNFDHGEYVNTSTRISKSNGNCVHTVLVSYEQAYQDVHPTDCLCRY